MLEVEAGVGCPVLLSHGPLHLLLHLAASCDDLVRADAHLYTTNRNGAGDLARRQRAVLP
jgi:hypothetical protein